MAAGAPSRPWAAPAATTVPEHSLGPPSGVSVAPSLQFLSASEFDPIARLGTGMFGFVSLVRHRPSGSTFALKTCSKADVVRLKQVEHVYSEKQIMLATSHPNFVRLYGTFQDARNLYFVMEPALGGELFNVLRRDGSLGLERSRFYAAQIISALEYLHQRSIVYRDLKPENILFDSRGNVKLADFGFAKHVPQNRTYTMCGTADYLAPEIILGRGYGLEVDWWALGVLLFEMLVGYPPFYDEQPFAIYENILNNAVNWPAVMERDAEHMLRCLLQRDNTKRWGVAPAERNLKRHPFFQAIRWEQLHNTPAPCVPTLRSDTDVSHFAPSPDDELQFQQQLEQLKAAQDIVVPDELFREF